MKKVNIFLITVLFIFIGLQFYPVQRTNGDNKDEIIVDDKVKDIFKRSCYDCHSNLTKWPFYSYVFPFSLWITSHVEDGRYELNFSTWERKRLKKKNSKAEDIVKEIKSGNMPLGEYLYLHPEAKLTPKEIEIVSKWAKVIEKEYFKSKGIQ